MYRKHATTVVYHKDKYTHESPFLNDMKALNICLLSIFNALFYI